MAKASDHAVPVLVAPYAAYQEVHMYVGNEKALEYLKKRLKLRSAEQGANLILMLPHYKHSVFHDSRIIDGLRVVSDIQLYLDLHGYYRYLSDGHTFLNVVSGKKQ